MKYKYFFAIALLFSLLLASCSGSFINGTRGNQKITSEKRDAGYFNKIKVIGSTDVTVVQSAEEEVLIETDSNIQEQVITEIKNQTLIIYTEGSVSPSKLHAYIKIKNLNGIIITGSSDFNLNDSFKTEDCDLQVFGSGTIIGKDLTCKNLNIQITGSGGVDLQGSAEKGKCGISGSGDAKLLDFEFKEFEGKINGSGDINVLVRELLRIKINGSGDVQYKGDPKISQSINGSGDVNQIK